jgi:AcrR family transcriptional regulator
MSRVDLSPLKRVRQDRILDAAEKLFLEQGFRSATMEGIAAASGMSKVTIYGYFPDKEAAFLAVADRFALRLQQAVEEALASCGSLAERLCAGLMAKHRIVFETVRMSTHARDLFAANDRLSAGLFHSLDRSIEASMTGVGVEAGLTEAEALRLARVLFAASHGMAESAADLGAFEADLSFLVSKVAGAR